MRLYRYTCGVDDKYGVADNEKEAYEKRTQIDPTYHFLPVTIEEVKVEGYEITATPLTSSNPFDNMDKQKLRAWLDDKGIEYVPQWGEQKLRELALQHAS